MLRGYRNGLALAALWLGCSAWAVAQETGPKTAAPGQMPPAGARPPTEAQPVGQSLARLELAPKEFNFGEVWQGLPAKGEFTVKNTGAEALTLDAKSSCGCTVATKPKSPLEPGESSTFMITYDTKRAGTASKKVTLTTNDPTQPSVEIPVLGTVKALFSMTPSDTITFQEAERDTQQTQAIKMENKYDRPVNLKLKEGQDFGRFEVQLKEIKPGLEYELTAATNPPLQNGWNRAAVILETGLQDVPMLTVNVTANIQPRVMLTTLRLFVDNDAPQDKEYMVRVQYRTDVPTKITEVKSDVPGLKTEIVPPQPPPAGRKTAYLEIRATVPANTVIPGTGAKLEIFTDDKDPQFQKLELPIMQRPSANRGVVPGAPSPTTQGAVSGKPPLLPKPTDRPGDDKPAGVGKKP